jgi:ABC-type lipoprotein export system ATPase subunit
VPSNYISTEATGMITLRGISRTFGRGDERTEALRGVDLDVSEGEFLTVMGPSGCGKSTLLSVVGMLDGEWQGEYHFLDQAVHKLKQKRRIDLNRKYMGFVFQQYHLIDSVTVYENLEIPLSYRKIPPRERTRMVDAILERFEIGDKKRLYPSSLSGGVQQLVGVARAVVAQPSIILADEPTGNLHSEQARDIMELFQELNRGGTTIMQVTHSEENAKFGSRTVEMLDGGTLKH